nr:unnamed protein product [Callosobruchus analis]
MMQTFSEIPYLIIASL